MNKIEPGVTLFHAASLREQGGRHHMLHSIWESLPDRAWIIHHLHHSPIDDWGVSFQYAKYNMRSWITRVDIKGSQSIAAADTNLADLCSKQTRRCSHKLLHKARPRVGVLTFPPEFSCKIQGDTCPQPFLWLKDIQTGLHLCNC